MRSWTWYKNLDYLTIFLWLALVVIGLVAIYSTTQGPAAAYLLDTEQQSFQRQLAWAVICVVGIAVALLLPVRFFQASAYLIYAGTILLLLAALVFGDEINGARSWIRFGPVGLQSAELAKVGTLLAVAHLLSSKRPGTDNVRFAVATVALILIPAVLIILQNDTGTALVFLALIPIMLYWSGLPITAILLVIAPGLAGYLAIWSTWAGWGFAALFTLGIFLTTRQRMLTSLAGVFTGGTVVAFSLILTKILQPYQLARILSFTNPEAEEYRTGVGFNLVQSKAAIGSGGLFGKGFMEGTQTQGRYVPAQSTDFVFSVIGEEFGFIGSLLLLTLFACLLLRLIGLGMDMKHPFGALLAWGTVGVLLIHIFVNVGMATGLLPVIGIPLPFISYGGSALLANSAMVAIALSLHMRRDDFSIYGY
ncbi:MAG: rod shape-determining protein RodA [Bacteroidota bacterium]